MKKYLFQSNKNIYKANLHCHTNISDGELTPQEVKEAYMAKGYSIVAFTDHNILKNHSYLNEDGFLAINSCEVDVTQNIPGQHWDNLKVYHFNLYAMDPDIQQTPTLMTMGYNDIDAINMYIHDRVQEGFLVCYNHPAWSLQTYADYSKLKGCFAMEIYNHSCQVTDGPDGYSPHAYDDMLMSHGKLFCVSADDNHNTSVKNPEVSCDSFGGFVMINSHSLKYSHIMDALQKGDFYSSQGPEIYEISLEGSKLTVKCSNVSHIIAYTGGRHFHVKKGKDINQAEFSLSGNERYVRIMCRDDNGLDANSSAYWLT